MVLLLIQSISSFDVRWRYLEMMRVVRFGLYVIPKHTLASLLKIDLLMAMRKTKSGSGSDLRFAADGFSEEKRNPETYPCPLLFLVAFTHYNEA